MSDVFGEVAGVTVNPEEERTNKINSILDSLRTKQSTVAEEKDTTQNASIQQQEDKTQEQTTVKTLDEVQSKDYSDSKGEEDDNYRVDPETEETIQGLMDEIDGLEKELAVSKARIRELETQNDYLSGSNKNFIDKLNAMEFDADRQTVPKEMKALIKYYQDSASESEEISKDAKKYLESEIFRLTEKITGKSLSSYISDYKTFGAETIDISGLGGLTFSPNTQKPNNGQNSIYDISASESPF